MTKGMRDEAGLESLAQNFDHLSNEFRDRRLEFYGYLHDNRRAIMHSNNSGGFWYVPRYDLGVAIQRDTEVFSNKRFTIPERPVPPFIPATLDPPEHSHYKQMLSRLFTPKRAAAMAPRIRALSDELISGGVARGKFDMVQEVMLTLMAQITMADVLGLEVGKAAAYSLPIHHMTQRDYPHDAAARELAWLGEQLTADIREQRVDPRGILGELSRIDFQGRLLNDQELQMIAMNLLTGGIGTTAFFMGSVTVFLGRHPQHRRQLIDDSALVGAAIEELLRVFPPTQNFGRSVARDTQIAGCPIRKGEKVMIGYGAANFDPLVFPDPQKIDFTRKAGLQMSFGIGPHRCLGVHLAKQIATTVTTTLLEKAPRYRLVEQELGQNTAMASMLGYHRVPLLAAP